MERVKIFVLVLVLLVSNVYAAEHYIRDGATGDGSDWTNAWDSLPTTLIRGDTYYIADGTYPGYTFDDAESGTQYITIKKATVDDHGTDTGWQSSYGDGVAHFTTGSSSNVISFSTSYWIMDGQVRSDWDSGYGFKISTTVPLSTQIVKIVRISNGVSYVTLKYCDMQHRGDGISDVGDDIIYAPGAGSGISISNCYLHDCSRNGIVMTGNNHLLEYSLMARTRGAGSTHAQGLQLFGTLNDFTIKNNIFRDIQGTATIACAWGTDGLYVYGNVFWQSDGQYYNSPATIVDISQPDETGMTNARIYNNLWYHYTSSSGHPGVSVYHTTDSSTNLIYNNLFYDSLEIVLDSEDAIHDYNTFIDSTPVWNFVMSDNEGFVNTGNPVADSDNYNFELINPTEEGMIFSWMDNLDPINNNRGSDGNWDRGAYEFLGVSDCGNGQCEPQYGEDCTTCPADCGTCDTICGDGNCDATESCVTCETDCGECQCVPVHDADNNPCDGVVSTEELSAYIDEWKAGTVNIQDLMEAIVEWKE